MTLPFQVGEIYNRTKDLHGIYGGNPRGGMCPCKNFPFIFLFTGSSGVKHGYEDKFIEDGKFLYTGEEQYGDMKFLKGNKALRDHISNNVHALVFEKLGGGNYRFVGEFIYLDSHFETRPDTDGNLRQAIIFELANESLENFENFDPEDASDKPKKLPKSLTKSEMRELAKKGSSKHVKAKSTKTRVYYRNQAVKDYALLRAEGVCEACSNKAPFINKRGYPFLEVHHMFRIADGGPDDPEGVAAICPNCHRRIHNGKDGDSINKELIYSIAKKEFEYEEG